MIRRPVPPPARAALGAGCALAVVLGYSVLSWQAHRENPDNTTVPNAAQLWAGVTELVTPNRAGDVALVEDAAATARRFALGMAAGVGLSFLVGVAMGCLTPVGAALGPTLLFFGAVPPTAMLAIYYRVFGTGELLYVGLIALGVFPLLAGGLYKSVLTDVTDHAVFKAYTLGASDAEVVWNVVVPQTLPRFIEGVRLAAGLGMIFLIAAEWLLAGEGFGHTLRLRSNKAAMDEVYPYLFLLGAFGLAVDYGLLRLRRWLAPWWRG